MTKKLYGILYFVAQLSLLDLLQDDFYGVSVYFYDSINLVIAGGIIWALVNIFLENRRGYIIAPIIQSALLIFSYVVFDEHRYLLFVVVPVCLLNILLGLWLGCHVFAKKLPQRADVFQSSPISTKLKAAAMIAVSSTIVLKRMLSSYWGRWLCAIVIVVALGLMIATLVESLLSAFKNGISNPKVIEKTLPSLFIGVVYLNGITELRGYNYWDEFWYEVDSNIYTFVLILQMLLMLACVVCSVVMITNVVMNRGKENIPLSKTKQLTVLILLLLGILMLALNFIYVLEGFFYYV